MDVVLLSRLQFAATIIFHFLFVPLTLGLSFLIAIMQTIWFSTGDDDYRRLARFWGKLFVINFAIGVVTGIPMEFQFGTNWSRYSQYVGDIFGSLLAIEATAAFFLESTFIAVWIFGWNRVSPRLHLAAIWIVALASSFSAYWILAANSFMQHPVGYTIRNGRAELSDFLAVVTQKWALLEFFHVVGGSLMLAAFFVMGISAWHLARGNEVGLFKKSFSLAAVFAVVFSISVALSGDISGQDVAEHQPAKLAAMESHWETQRRAPIYLLAWPGSEGNLVQALPIPGILSLLSFHDINAEVKGLADIPVPDRPPVLPTFLAFRVMVGIGTLLIFLAIWAWLRRNKLTASPLLLRILPWAIPLPYIALEAGWTVAEVGRQPWLVWGLMRTSDGVSPIAASQVATSLVGMILVYGLLGFTACFLLFKYARQGPEPKLAAADNGGEGVANA